GHLDRSEFTHFICDDTESNRSRNGCPRNQGRHNSYRTSFNATCLCQILWQPCDNNKESIDDTEYCNVGQYKVFVFEQITQFEFILWIGLSAIFFCYWFFFNDPSHR